MDLLSNVHIGLEDPSFMGSDTKKVNIVKGAYHYYHYKCTDDSISDVGWGCGYRTLQTMISYLAGGANKVPSIDEIQQILVDLDDKPASFYGSRQWIGSFEICLVIDKLLDIPCKILHCPAGTSLFGSFTKLEEHFEKWASPVMMGGDRDASSKGILGTCSSQGHDDRYLLILDPHYHGKRTSAVELQRQGYIKWMSLNEFDPNSFYNLCMPQSSALCTL